MGLTTTLGFLAYAAPSSLAASGASPAGAQPVWRQVNTGGAFTCALKTNLELYCWGANGHGQLGLGSTVEQVKPTKVNSEQWRSVNAGLAHVCGIQSDLSLWCWGSNAFGQLGVGDTTDRLVPTKVDDSSWLTVSAGFAHTCGLRADFTVWCWGAGLSGQLGQGDTVSHSSPVQVGSDNGWRVLRAGGNHTCAITFAFRMSCWGGNAAGQLGLGDRDNREVPVQLAGAWLKVGATAAHTCAIRKQLGSVTQGELWCWGLNRNGQLGLGDRTSVDKPKQVGSATDWLGIAPGYQHTCAVRSQTRVLYCWGSNRFGQLGLGDVKRRLSPEQVTSKGWKGPSSGFEHTCSTKVDFTLWCWGGNSAGQLGLGNHDSKLVPTQV